MDDVEYLKAEAARCLALAAAAGDPAVARRLRDYANEFEWLAAAVARDEARGAAAD